MGSITCARCGEVHEIEDDDAEFTKEAGCPDCQDWTKCAHCDEWFSPDEEFTGVHSGGRVQQWCSSCTEDAHQCEHCSEYFASELHTVRVDGGSEEWCRSCRSENAWECQHCVEWFESDSFDPQTSTIGSICGSCAESHYEWCDTHDVYQSASNPCSCTRHGSAPSTAAHPYQNSGKWSVKGYGGHGSFTITNKWGTKRLAVPAIGMEMEVGDFLSDKHRNAFGESVFVPLLGEKFAYPTSDSSLGPRGIEFIGHPMGALDHIAMVDEYTDFFCGLVGNQATCATSPSGCHTNFSRDCFVNDDALRAAIIACVRFYDALMLFTHPDQKRGRMGFCKKADLRSGIDPLVQCKSSGKYSIVNIKPNEGSCGIVEFRLAGMTLHKGRFLAQLQMYHNLVAWANKNAQTPEKAGWDSFEDIFLPVMYQSDIHDVIKKGRVAMQLPLGDPSLSSVSGRGLEITNLHGAVGYPAKYSARHDSSIRDIFRQVTQFHNLPNVRPGDLAMDRQSRQWIVVTQAGNMEANGVEIFRPDARSLAEGAHSLGFKWKVHGCAVRYFMEDEIVDFHIHGIGSDEQYRADLLHLPSSI